MVELSVVGQFHFRATPRRGIYQFVPILSFAMQRDDTEIDTTDPEQKWRWKCPECTSTNWRVHNGTIGCRACSTTVEGLVNAETGEYTARSELDFVGPHANHKANQSLPDDILREGGR